MSLHEYQQSIELGKLNYPFYTLILTAMRDADSENLTKLRIAFPTVFNELIDRYNSPNGVLPWEQKLASANPKQHERGKL